MDSETVTLKLTFDVRVTPDRAEFLKSLLESSPNPSHLEFLLKALHFRTIQPENIRLEVAAEPGHEEEEEPEWVTKFDFTMGATPSNRSALGRAFSCLARGLHSGSTYFPALKTIRTQSNLNSQAMCRQDLVRVFTGQENQESIVRYVTNYGPGSVRVMCSYLGVEYKLAN